MMEKHDTGWYEVQERNGGLDVYENGEFVCELNGYSLDDFRDEDDNFSKCPEVDDDRLNEAIKAQVEVDEFCEEMYM